MVGCVYKHIQINWKYPYPKTTLIVTPRSAFSPQRDSNNDCSATIFSHNQYLPVSNLTTKNQVDNSVKNNDNTQYFATPIKHNQNNP